MKRLEKLTGLIALTLVLLSLTACGTSTIRTDKAPLRCEEEGTKPREERPIPPTGKVTDEEYHLWMAGAYAWSMRLYKQDDILLNCWNAEQANRGR
jgi:hypothetical protein